MTRGDGRRRNAAANMKEDICATQTRDAVTDTSDATSDVTVNHTLVDLSTIDLQACSYARWMM